MLQGLLCPAAESLFGLTKYWHQITSDLCFLVNRLFASRCCLYSPVFPAETKEVSTLQSHALAAVLQTHVVVLVEIG